MLFIFMLLFICFSNLFAQHDLLQGRIYHNWGWRDQSFSFLPHNRVEFRIDFSYRANRPPSRTGTYSIEHKYNVPFLNLYWDDGSRDRYLMLFNDEILLLYKDNSIPRWNLRITLDKSKRWVGQGLMIMESITASSTLIEGHLHYAATPERLGEHINRVWAAEGGIGERLYIEFPSRACPHSLIISTGYVHFSRPYLFQHNARPKKLRIFNPEDMSRFMDVELEDTPNPQFIDFNTYCDEWINILGINHRIIIEILEIFPGTRFNHLCINSILMWSTI